MNMRRGARGRAARYESPFPVQGENEAPINFDFVPSFCVSRSAIVDDSARGMQVAVRKNLSRKHYVVPDAEDLTSKIIDQKKFVNQMRSAGISPSSEDMRDLAYAVRDDLRRSLGEAPARLAIPLGQLTLVGCNKQAIGVEPLGWGGYNGRYAQRDETGELLALGTLAAEKKACIGSIATAMSELGDFVVDGLAETPHIMIARKANNRAINPHKFDDRRGALEDILPAEIVVGDPVIYLRTARDAETEIIPVRYDLAA